MAGPAMPISVPVQPAESRGSTQTAAQLYALGKEQYNWSLGSVSEEGLLLCRGQVPAADLTFKLGELECE